MNILKNLFWSRSTHKTDYVSLSKKDFNSFLDLIEQNGISSFEKQLNFLEIIGSNSWQFDMDKGEISFSNNLIFSVQIIGSISFRDNSWMWGWANKQSGIPETLLIQSNRLREIGELRNINELKNPHFNIKGRFDHQIGLIASGLFKSECYYSANYEKGSLICTIDSPKVPAPKVDFIKVLTTFSQFVADFEISHKEAFKNYMIDKGYLIRIGKDSISGLRNNEIITAEFDSLNRMTSIKNE